MKKPIIERFQDKESAEAMMEYRSSSVDDNIKSRAVVQVVDIRFREDFSDEDD